RRKLPHRGPRRHGASDPLGPAAPRQWRVGVPYARSDGGVPEVVRRRRDRLDHDSAAASGAFAALAQRRRARLKTSSTEERMREALIVWGGWSGHEPEQGAHIVAKMLEEHEFKVYVENTTEAFADPAIADMSLIVPIVTMSKIEKEEVENLTAAVRGGVGLA